VIPEDLYTNLICLFIERVIDKMQVREALFQQVLSSSQSKKVLEYLEKNHPELLAIFKVSKRDVVGATG
jgi:hypothetical protein